MMDNDRRTFLKNSLLATSALAVSSSISAQSGRSADLRRIAVEETFTVPEVLDATMNMLARDPDRRPPIATPLEPSMAEALLDLGEGRIAAMDAARIDKEVLSLWSPGVQIFDPALGTELARLTNDRLAEAIRRYPDRFAGLTTVAPQDPEAAAQEVHRGFSDLGLNGVLINSHTNGEFLDERKYWPILEAAESLNTPIYMHPRIPPAQIYDAVSEHSLSGALWGFGMEASLHAVRLLMSGVFEQFPRLKIVLGHMGEGVPFWLRRLDVISSTRPAMPQLRRLPSEYFMDNFMITTSAMFWDPLLLFCHSVLGAERIMFAIDTPFAPAEPATRWMDAVPLPEPDKRRIYQENAEEVFSL